VCGDSNSQCLGLQNGKEGGSGKLWASQPHLCPWKSAISKQLVKKKVIRNSQHGFTKGKSCLNSIVALYNGITSWVDGRKAVDVIYLDCSKAFDIVYHDILLMKLRKCGIDEWMVG